MPSRARKDGAIRTVAASGAERAARVASTLLQAPWAGVVMFEGAGIHVRACACDCGDKTDSPVDRAMLNLCGAVPLGEILFAEDASADERFEHFPEVVGGFGIRMFVAVPIRRADGELSGALCACDTSPRRISPDEAEALGELAALVEDDAIVVVTPAAPVPAREALAAKPTNGTAPVAIAGRPSDTSMGRRDLLAMLMEFTSEAIGLINADGRVRFTAGAHFAVLGYHPDELLGRDIFEFVHPEDQHRMRESLARILPEPGARTSAYARFRHAKGHWIALDVQGVNLLHLPGVSGIFLHAREAGERLRAESQVEESESRFRQLFEDNPQAMWAFDFETRRFLAVNDAAIRQYGYSREEFMELSMDELRPPEDVAMFHAHMGRRIEAPVRRTWRHRKRSGEIITVEIYATTVNFRGRKARLVAMQDITERTSAVESLKRRNRYMNAQVELQIELLKPRPLSESIDALLGSLGKAAGASRAYYYVNGNDARSHQLYALPAQEWCAPGIFSEMEVFGKERVPYDAYDPQWLRKLQAGEALTLEVDTLPEPGRSLFSSGGVRSALLAPVLVRGSFIGFLGLDDCMGPRRWDRSEADLLQAASAALALALEAESASQSLDEEKDRFAVTLASIADGVVTTDSTGRVVFANRVAETLLGRTQQELAGCELSSFFYIGTATGGFRGDPLPRVLQSGEVVIQPSGAFAMHKGGTRIPVSESSAPIRNRAGKIIGAVRVFRDTTPEQRMASEMAKASKLESIGILAGGIAHDFNNILTAVVGNVSLAKMFLHDPERAAAKLDEAERASFRAKDLTSQLLTFSKGGAPIKKLAKLGEIIRESVDFALHGSKVLVRFSLPDDLPPVEVDAGQLSQVINNLAINAVQAMPDGGTIDVWAQDRELEEGHPTGLPPGRFVKICVEDNGRGIPAENQSKIFDPFFTTKDHGSGLGLATSYSIIKNHGGVINFDSIVGQGTIFRVYLPASSSALPLEVPNHGSVGPRPGTGRILVMDDEADIRFLVATMLEQLGYDVTTVPDGQAALDHYERSIAKGRPFDAFILDLTVPGGLGGVEVMEHLRQHDPTPRVIVSSGYANAPIMADYARFGFADMLTKPYRVEEISEVLDRVLTHPKPAA